MEELSLDFRRYDFSINGHIFSKTRFRKEFYKKSLFSRTGSYNFMYFE